MQENFDNLITSVESADEMAALQASYEHLQKMRDELVTLGIIPSIENWKTLNPNL